MRFEKEGSLLQNLIPAGPRERPMVIGRDTPFTGAWAVSSALQ